ncbi:MAG TPA: hypothetical protein VF896_06710 [Anaerolineales bacterium]
MRRKQSKPEATKQSPAESEIASPLATLGLAMTGDPYETTDYQL